MDTVKQVPLVTHYPKSPDASIDALRRLSGIVSLTGPVPPADFFGDADDEDIDSERPAKRAGD